MAYFDDESSKWRVASGEWRLGPSEAEARAKNSEWSWHTASRHVKAHDFNREGVNVFGVIIWNVNGNNVDAIGLTPGPSPEERGIPLSQCHENIREGFFW